MIPENSIVLYVEDDLDDQIIFKECVNLVRPDIICKFAKDGLIALAVLNAESTKPVCIFIDVNMPVMNGQELLARIRSTPGLLHIPCYMLSTSKNPLHIREAIAAGANDYLIKPAVYIDFQNLLRRTLERAIV